MTLRPSSKNALEEARIRLEEERARYKLLITKTGVLLTLNTIIATVIGSSSYISFLSKIFVLTPALVSSYYCMKVVETIYTERPGKKDISTYFEDAELPQKKFEEKWLINYKKSIDSHREETENTIEKFKTGYRLTAISGLFFIMALIVEAVLSWVSISYLTVLVILTL